jgi:hypothetical protein
MAIWTVDTWHLKPGSEAHFLGLCGEMNPSPLVLYRDLEEPGIFWSPAKWESLEALREWRSGEAYDRVVLSLADDIVDHESHIMTEVPEFLPQSSQPE